MKPLYWVSGGDFSEIAMIQADGTTVRCPSPPTQRYVRFNYDERRFEQRDNLDDPWEGVTAR